MDSPGTYIEWRVRGVSDPDWPPYEFVWSKRTHPGDPESAARAMVRVIADSWVDGPYLSHRTVTITEWETADV